MSEHRTLPARSASLTLPIPAVDPQPLRVLSAHRRAINLEDEAGNILAVVSPLVGDGPFHVVLEQFQTLGGVQAGEQAWRLGSMLQVGRWIIDWSKAKRWDPRLKPTTIPQTSLARLSECVRADARFHQRLTVIDRQTAARLQMGAALLSQGVLADDEQALRKGVSLLTGLGPGLTPAGDDYLLGALARQHMDAALAGGGKLAAFIKTNAALTTKLSRAWLLHGVNGAFDERWHRLQCAFVEAQKQSICQASRGILEVGATSGPQALAGFLLT